MSERTSYAAGTPCWADLSTPDQDAAGEFYGGLFGWAVKEGEDPEATGGYREAWLDGRAVGGVMSLMQEGQPTAWMPYIASDDVDATAARAREAGGSVLAGPMSVLDFGRMAVLADPAGAVFGVWQAGKNVGWDVRDEPGAPTWVELNTRDVEGAAAFYGTVFGWEFDRRGLGGGEGYTTLKLNGAEVGGALDQAERGVPAEVPPYWAVYFAVEDADAAVARAGELGGGVMLAPFEVPVGRMALLTDPHGALFAVISLNEEARAAAG